MTTDEREPLDEFAFQMERAEPAYFAQIPGAIYHCTYVTEEKRKDNKHFGKKVRKKLSPQAIALYGYIKQLAGINGVVWANRDTLAEMIGVSSGAITKLKTELQQPLEQLNGKSLIEIVPRNRRKNGTGTLYHQCLIKDVWGENNAYMSTIKYQIKLPLGPVTMSRRDGDEATMSRRDSDHARAMSRRDTSNRSHRGRSILFDTDSAASGESCHPDGEDSVFSVKEQFEEMSEKVDRGMRECGCDDNMIKEMKQRYPLNIIFEAGNYVREFRKRGHIIKNPPAYLRKAIEKGLRWNYDKDDAKQIDPIMR